MGEAAATLGASLRCACIAIGGCLVLSRAATAFPAADPLNPSVVPTPSETPQPTESELQHQLQMQSGFGAPGGSGWSFTPGASLQEMFTDNVFQSPTNRRWDLITLLGPSFSLLGDVPNAQVRLNWAPQVRVFARDPHETGINQQVLGTGLFTIIPEGFYVDLRAISAVGPTGGGFGALGLGNGTGASGTGSLGIGGTSAPGSIGALGLSKQNQTQTSSLSVSPYVMHRFGDIGTAKAGISYNQSSYSNSGSFLPLFFANNGASQYNRTLQELAQFQTGDFIFPWHDMIIADAGQTNGSGVSRNSSQDYLINRLGYTVSQPVELFGELGAERLRYGGIPPTSIDDMVWGIGTTLTPNPDSTLTLAYGHKQGVTGLQADGSYALTARTRISVRYSTGIQSDLEQIANQLDLADVNQLGNAVDSQTGAPLFIGTGGFGAQSSLSSVKNLTLTANTVLDRDQISLSVVLTQETTLANAPPGTVPVNPLAPPITPVGSTSNGKSAVLSWIHQVNEGLTLNGSLSYSATDFAGTGNFRSIGANAGLQYVLSETVSLNVRYSYFKRYSPVPGQDIYQNLALVGISKQF
jgi:uncharacterized protein (PEP-CTERM system associated)